MNKRLIILIFLLFIALSIFPLFNCGKYIYYNNHIHNSIHKSDKLIIYYKEDLIRNEKWFKYEPKTLLTISNKDDILSFINLFKTSFLYNSPTLVACNHYDCLLEEFKGFIIKFFLNNNELASVLWIGNDIIYFSSNNKHNITAKLNSNAIRYIQKLLTINNIAVNSTDNSWEYDYSNRRNELIKMQDEYKNNYYRNN